MDTMILEIPEDDGEDHIEEDRKQKIEHQEEVLSNASGKEFLRLFICRSTIVIKMQYFRPKYKECNPFPFYICKNLIL